MKATEPVSHASYLSQLTSRPLSQPPSQWPLCRVKAEVDPGLGCPFENCRSSHKARFLLVFAEKGFSSGTWHCYNTQLTQTRSHHCCGFGLAHPPCSQQNRDWSSGKNSCLVMKPAAKVLESFAKCNVDFYKLNKITPSSDFQSISIQLASGSPHLSIQRIYVQKSITALIRYTITQRARDCTSSPLFSTPISINTHTYIHFSLQPITMLFKEGVVRAPFWRTAAPPGNLTVLCLEFGLAWILFIVVWVSVWDCGKYF